MTSLQRMITVVAVLFTLPAQALFSDPEIVIYRFAGVRDDGGINNVGVATVFVCTNYSGATENVRWVTRGPNGDLLTNAVTVMNHLTTVTASTHPTLAYFNNLNLNTGQVQQGTTAIAATSANVICTAMALDAANAKPDGVALRGVRFNPAPGSQE